MAIQTLGSTAGQYPIWKIYARGVHLEEKERSISSFTRGSTATRFKTRT